MSTEVTPSLYDQQEAAVLALHNLVKVVRVQPREPDVSVKALLKDDLIAIPFRNAKDALRPLLGKTILFGAKVPEAFALDRGNVPPYKRLVLPYGGLGKRIPVIGNLTGALNVGTRGIDRTPAFLRKIEPSKDPGVLPRFCLRVAAMGRTASPEWIERLESTRLATALTDPALDSKVIVSQDPLVKEQFTGHSVCVSLINIDLNTLRVLQSPQDSLHLHPVRTLPLR